MFGNLHGSSPTVVASLSWNLPANISEEKQNIEQVSNNTVRVSKYHPLFVWLSIRIREVMELNLDIVDFDGSSIEKSKDSSLKEYTLYHLLYLPHHWQDGSQLMLPTSKTRMCQR